MVPTLQPSMATFLPGFDEALIINKFKKLQESFANNAISSFTINTSPVPKLPQKHIWCGCNKHCIFAPDPCDNNWEVSTNIAAIKQTAMIQSDDELNEDDVRHEETFMMPNAPLSTGTETAEQALGGHFTCLELQTLDNWPDWSAGECKQLDQFCKLGMCGKPCKLPPNGILLRSHWQCQVHHNGNCQSQNCCNGSKCATPSPREIAKTHSSCLEQPMQRPFVVSLCCKKSMTSSSHANLNLLPNAHLIALARNLWCTKKLPHLSNTSA